MRAEQFEPLVRDEAKRMLEQEKKEYETSHCAVMAASKLLQGIMTPAQTAYRDAYVACMETTHKFRLAFLYGYLALEKDFIGDEGAREALFREIAEYLRLVGAGIDSFVATHPIRAVEKEETT